MANLSSTSATNSQVNEVHSNDNPIFDNVDYQLNQEMHQEEHLDSDAETEIDDNTIPYHQYLLDTEAQNVPTEVSADTSDKVSMIAILTDLQTQLDGHAKVNQEKCLEVETLKNELSQCKQEIYRLDTQKVKLDLEHKVRLEQALVIQRNKRNAELVQENDLLKSTLSGKEKSITFLQSEKEKILSEKKDLADSYLDEIVCLKNANKVARDMLQRFNMPTQTIPMLSKKPKNATNDLHKDLLGTRNPGLGYMAKRAQPALYDADTLLHPTHISVIYDSEGLVTKWIQLDGLKVENVSLKRRYDELSQANTHSRTAYTEKLSAFTAENTKLKAQVTGKTSSGPSTSEKPKVLASGMYTNSSKYIPPPKRANWVKPTPLPKKKQVTFQEPPRTSHRPTQKPPVQQNKKPNVPVNVSTRTKPATESRKPMPKCHTWNHHILPNKSVNARRAAYHNRKLNVVDHNQFVIRSLKSVNTKTQPPRQSIMNTILRKVLESNQETECNTTRQAWRPKKCWSKGRTVADSIAARLTRLTAYKFKQLQSHSCMLDSVPEFIRPWRKCGDPGLPWVGKMIENKAKTVASTRDEVLYTSVPSTVQVSTVLYKSVQYCTSQYEVLFRWRLDQSDGDTWHRRVSFQDCYLNRLEDATGNVGNTGVPRQKAKVNEDVLVAEADAFLADVDAFDSDVVEGPNVLLLSWAHLRESHSAAQQSSQCSVVPPSSNCLCEDLRSACDREHTKVLELEAEISKQKQLITESEKRFAFLEQNYVNLQLKFQNYKQCIDTSSASNAIFEINKLRQQLQGKDDTIRNLETQINITRMLNVGSTEVKGISGCFIKLFLWYMDSGCQVIATVIEERLIYFVESSLGTVEIWQQCICSGSLARVIINCFTSLLAYKKPLLRSHGYGQSSDVSLFFGIIDRNWDQKKSCQRITHAENMPKDHLCPILQRTESILTEKKSSVMVIVDVHQNLDGHSRMKFASVVFLMKRAYSVSQSETVLSKDGKTNSYRKMLVLSHLLRKLTVPMGEVVATACYTLNRSMFSRFMENYYELLKGKKTNLNTFRVSLLALHHQEGVTNLTIKRTRKIIGDIPCHVAFDELTEGFDVCSNQSQRSALVKGQEPPSVHHTKKTGEIHVFERLDVIYGYCDHVQIYSYHPAQMIFRLSWDEFGRHVEDTSYDQALFIAHAACMEHGHLPDGRENRLTNGDLMNVVYVSQTRGFVNYQSIHRMCTAQEKLSMDSNKLLVVVMNKLSAFIITSKIYKMAWVDPTLSREKHRQHLLLYKYIVDELSLLY
ncbi:hypothetical protein Tco_0064295 [Tanacetum coccineum]